MEITKQNIIKVFKRIEELKDKNNYVLFFMGTEITSFEFNEDSICFINYKTFVVVHIDFEKEIIKSYAKDLDTDYTDCDSFVWFLDHFKFFQENNIIDEISEKVGSYESEIKF